MRMTVESMDEDNINDRVWRLVDDVQAELPNARCEIHRRTELGSGLEMLWFTYASA